MKSLSGFSYDRDHDHDHDPDQDSEQNVLHILHIKLPYLNTSQVTLPS